MQHRQPSDDFSHHVCHVTLWDLVFFPDKCSQRPGIHKINDHIDDFLKVEGFDVPDNVATLAEFHQGDLLLDLG